jgi:hypothetical protein
LRDKLREAIRRKYGDAGAGSDNLHGEKTSGVTASGRVVLSGKAADMLSILDGSGQPGKKGRDGAAVSGRDPLSGLPGLLDSGDAQIISDLYGADTEIIPYYHPDSLPDPRQNYIVVQHTAPILPNSMMPKRTSKVESASRFQSAIREVQWKPASQVL